MSTLQQDSVRTLPADAVCDRCGSRAYVRASMLVDRGVVGEAPLTGSEMREVALIELDLCGHHGRAYKDELARQGFEIDDCSAALHSTGMTSANV